MLKTLDFYFKIANLCSFVKIMIRKTEKSKIPSFRIADKGYKRRLITNIQTLSIIQS